MTSHDANETHTDDRSSLGQAIEELVQVGLFWARHGLELGRQSVLASARTLEGTAAVLGELAHRFPDRQSGERP